MASKLVSDYARTAQMLISALRAHASSAQGGADATLGSMVGPDERVPDVGFLAELLARRLEHDRAELERAEQAQTAEPSDTTGARLRRDEAAQELFATLLEVRRSVGALFGTAWVQKLDFPRELHHDAPLGLLRAGRDVARALKVKQLPKPVVDGIRKVDAGPWQKRLKKATRELEVAQVGVREEERQTDAGFGAKARALAAFERTFSAASKLATGLLELAGADDQAGSLPGQPRKGREKKKAPTERSKPPATDGAGSDEPTAV